MSFFMDVKNQLTFASNSKEVANLFKLMYQQFKTSDSFYAHGYCDGILDAARAFNISTKDWFDD